VIYHIIHGKSTVETDRKTIVTRKVNKLKRKGLKEGKDFRVLNFGK